METVSARAALTLLPGIFARPVSNFLLDNDNV